MKLIKKEKEQSEYSTFGRNEFRNAHTGEMQKSVTIDWSPKGSSQVYYTTNEELPSKVYEEPKFEEATYIRIEGSKENPKTEGTYFTSHGEAKYEGKKWYLSGLKMATPLWWLKMQ